MLKYRGNNNKTVARGFRCEAEFSYGVSINYPSTSTNWLDYFVTKCFGATCCYLDILCLKGECCIPKRVLNYYSTVTTITASLCCDNR